MKSDTETPKPKDGRSYRTYWKQQRRLENLRTERDLLGRFLEVARVFAATGFGSWLIAYILVTALDDNHLKFLPQGDAVLVKTIITSAEVIGAIGSSVSSITAAAAAMTKSGAAA